MRVTRDHWPDHARRWSLVGPPLRPGAEDLAFVERALPHTVRRALLLGATGELATMRWPTRTQLTAVDRIPAVLAHLFPRAAGTPVVGDWRALPFADRTFDAIVGDGVLSVLAIHDYPAIAAELARVLAPGGRVVLRLFASPPTRESLADISRALPAGFHALKWRIAMAIADDRGDVRVSDILAAFDRLAPDRAALPYDRAVVDGIDVYRESGAVYSFPTETAALAPLAAAGLRVASRHQPTYELGERCPTYVLMSEP